MSDRDLMSQAISQRRTYYNGLVAEETAALTYLAAVNRLNAQERLASQTRSGPTSRTSTTTDAPATSGDSELNCIAQAESGGNPTIYNESGSGASGLYQFMPGTWNDYDGYANAADAPAAVQTQKAEQTPLSAWTGDPCVG